ncbi:MAG TPA: GAF domain-containing protein [Bacteroidales bacterium]|nr:GAF domain-containing protein [Bacteroidales bacterium]
MGIFKSLYFNPLVNKLNQNLSIRHKTYLAFLFVSLFFFIFLIVQLVSFSRLNKTDDKLDQLICLHNNSAELARLVQEQNLAIFASPGRQKGVKSDFGHLQNQINQVADTLCNYLKTGLLPAFDVTTWEKKLNNNLNDLKLVLAQYSAALTGTNIQDGLSDGHKNLSAITSRFVMLNKQTETLLGLLDGKILTMQEILIQNRHSVLTRVYWQSAILFVLGVFIALIIANFVAYRITDPIEKVKKNIDVLAIGEYEFPEAFDVVDNDEIGEIIRGIERLGGTMKQTILFAEEVGRNNFNSKIQFEGKGKLATALLTMRDNLKEMTEQTKNQQEEEEKRSNVMQQLSDLTVVLRNNTDKLSDFYSNILRHLVKSVQGIQGGLFLVKEQDGEEPVLELKTAFAYDRRKYLHKEFLFGEGVIGRCALEREKIMMTDLPDDYMKITSGLGQAEPSSLILIPILLNDALYGVIEISSFNAFDSYQVDFLEKAAENIASTVHNVRVNEQTSKLFEKTKIQAEELASQEEEMKQNLEELQATQEEAGRKSDNLKRMLDESQERVKILEEELHEAHKEITHLKN